MAETLKQKRDPTRFPGMLPLTTAVIAWTEIRKLAQAQPTTTEAAQQALY
jgi:hypothetical protein